jgi:S1-C subfamily serine protease
MRLKRIANLLAALVFAASVGVAARGATVTLKDGTVIVGSLSRLDDGYQIKSSDGGVRKVKDGEVASISSDSVMEDSAPAGLVTAGASPEFRAAKGRADDVKSALAAVAIWQKFIDDNPGNRDLPMAREEIAHWQSLADEGAEKVGEAWIGGDRLAKMKEKSAALTHEAYQLWTHSATLSAIDKLHEAVKVYPNSFVANYDLGYLSMVQHNYDDAIGYFQATVRLTPDSPEALNNLAVAHFFRRHFEEGIEGLGRAIRIADTKQIAQNLVTAMDTAPQGVRSDPRFKPMRQTAELLAAKYSLNGPAEWLIIEPPPPMDSGTGEGQLPPSVTGGGTGVVIRDDGLILTNRHVVKAGTTYLVLLNKHRYSAEVVAMDGEYDLALMRIKAAEKLPVARLSPEDSPPDGADCTVIGYPLLFDIGLNAKITHGIVSSGSERGESGADVLLDARVNRGNSGGPIVDKFGNVIAIVCMKTYSSAQDDSYGIGISAGHIREFLQRNHVTAASGAEGESLSTEQVVAKVKPATVCILVSK